MTAALDSYAIANVLKVCSGECFGIFAQTCVRTMIQKSAGVELWHISSICAMCFWNMRYYNAASTMLWLWQLGLFAIEIMMIIRNHHHRPLQYLPGSTSDPVSSDLHRCHRFSETYTFSLSFILILISSYQPVIHSFLYSQLQQFRADSSMLNSFTQLSFMWHEST